MPPVFSIPGGIHPEENKVQSLTKPIQAAIVPETLVIPVSQPGFQEPEILVSLGDKVLKGQLIARGKQKFGLSCHASSSGTVTAIEERAVPNPSGLAELCISIKTDGLDQWLKHSGQQDFLSLNAEQILKLIADSGISGLGGAGFPTHIKLDNDAIDTLIINACECEPFITADDALMRERAHDIIIGIQILLHILKPKQCLIGIEDNKPEAFAALDRANKDPRINIVSIPTKYPSGAEKQLIQLLTGKEIPSGSLTIHAGILCQNIASVHAIARAVCHGEPLISRITTLTGAALQSPCNQEVLIGTPISTLLSAQGINTDQLSELIMGGPMMGIKLPSTDLPVVKISNCLIATTKQELPPAPPAQACIRCGLCADACPVNLLPQQLYWFARSKEHEKSLAHNLMDCIECGACAYVCPSNIPLVQYYRASKASIKDENEKHKRGDYSQQRFEFRELRIEKDKAIAEKRRQERAEISKKNREAKAKAKAEAAKNDTDEKKSDVDNSEDPIQAALDRVKAKKAAAQKETSQGSQGELK